MDVMPPYFVRQGTAEARHRAPTYRERWVKNDGSGTLGYCLMTEGLSYEELLTGLRSGWMSAFERKQMPIYVVQIAPYHYPWIAERLGADFCDAENSSYSAEPVDSSSETCIPGSSSSAWALELHLMIWMRVLI